MIALISPAKTMRSTGGVVSSTRIMGYSATENTFYYVSE